MDGSGNIWTANNSTTTAPVHTIRQYIPGTQAAVGLSPCFVAAGMQSCATALSQPQRTLVDSTGSVWITSLNNGRIYQLLGPGAPTWPQLFYSQPGVQP